jgi:predicted nucleotidyltransferase
MEAEDRSRAIVDWDASRRRRCELDAELARIVRQLPRLGVQRAVVFGSYARGDVGGRSDLDMILVAERGDRFVDRCAAFYQMLSPAVGVDLLVYTPEEFETIRQRPFFRKAIAEGRVVYEA